MSFCTGKWFSQKGQKAHADLHDEYAYSIPHPYAALVP